MNQPSLADVAKNLVLAHKGRWFTSYGVCLCPAHPDKNPSLRVNPGRNKLMFHCYAGCDYRTVETLITCSEAAPTRMFCEDDTRVNETSQARKDWIAQKLWGMAHPLPRSLASTYLARRHLTNVSTGSLRFLPRTRHPIRRTWHPALIALIKTADGIMTGIQTSYLDPQTCQLIQSEDRRTILGLQRGGAVQLSPASHRLGLTEGTETGLSVEKMFHLPVWASLSTKRLSRIILPDRITHLTIFADHDAAGLAAAKTARDAYARPGRIITIEIPDKWGEDWDNVHAKRERRDVSLQHA
jgi:putative DNA primase/helicase